LIDELVGPLSPVRPSELLPLTLSETEVKHKTENYIGCLPYPVGLCGPLVVNGQSYHVPLATLEGALVASYTRGSKIINASGGAQAVCLNDFITRGTLFSCKNLAHATSVANWARQHIAELTEVVNKSDRYASCGRFWVEVAGSGVLVNFEMTTGEAMGSNMGSKAAGDVGDYIVARSKLVTRDEMFAILPEDKRAIPMRMKGKKVVAQATITEEVLRSMTRATPKRFVDYVRTFKDFQALEGADTLNAHAVNGLTAMLIAFGQDVAYAGDFKAILDARLIESDSVQVSLSIPNLFIGTIGGGIGLPAFRANLAMVGCAPQRTDSGDKESHSTKKLAEVMAAVMLAGEISICAAMSSHEFIRAHETMGKN